MDFNKINFSLWLDFIHRDFLKDDFKNLIDNNIINGVTSNPSIFASSFVTETYNGQIARLVGESKKNIYEALAISDIKVAASKLLPLYLEDKTKGFVSIEIDPALCNDIAGSIEEGKRLYSEINMPNVMIKVPATTAGYHIIEALMSEGINVNITLVFSPTQALKTMQAILKSNSTAQAVISVFVSRFDRLLDAKLPLDMRGKVGIYNASKIYNLIQKSELSNTRTLFASTGVKGDVYPAEYYITELLYKNSINTAPLTTIEEFIKNDNIVEKKAIKDKDIEIFFKKLKDNKIDINDIYETLLKDGLKSFNEAFTELLDGF